MKKERVYTTANQTTIDELNEETLRSGRLNIMKSDEKGYYREVADKADKKDCTCYKCPKCEAYMKDYYEKTGELKPIGKIDKKEIDKAVKCVEENIKLTEEACKMIPFYDKGTHNPGEAWFLNIYKGDTPKNNAFAKHAVKLIDMVLKNKV